MYYMLAFNIAVLVNLLVILTLAVSFVSGKQSILCSKPTRADA
jgi:hypothetical protein